jgi:hypothetical protein
VHLSREVVRGAGQRSKAPPELYQAGKQLVRARIGRSSHAAP